MPHPSHPHRRSPRLLLGAVIVALVALSVQVVAPRLTPRADASVGTLLCVGFSGCSSAGMSDSGYHQHWGTMYWEMYSGRNCVNYAAYRMVASGMPNVRPWNGDGNAMNWGRAMSSITDSNPRQGAIAWWRANAPGAGSLGHVAYVERVISPTDIIVSESNWGSDFDWREITTSGGWPSGFIHFRDKFIKNLAAPTVAGGTPTVGRALTVTGGTWSPRATLSYQWLVGGAVHPGNSRRFVPAAFAYHQPVSVRITATAPGYSTAVRTLNLGTTAAGTMTPLAQPAVVGAAIVGQPLQVSGDQFSPAASGRKIQWYADGTPLGGVTGRTYTPGYNVVGKAITVSVTGARSGYNNLTLTSAPTAAVLEPMVTQIQAAAINGDAIRGSKLTVDPGTFAPYKGVNVVYQWMRDNQAILGATGASYRPTNDDVGHILSVQVDASADKFRDLVTTYRVPAPITTQSSIRLLHTTTPGRARIAVTIGAPGMARTDVVGTLTVQLGNQVHQVQVQHGYAVFSFGNIGGGRRTLVVTYSGSGYILGSKKVTAMWVRLKPKAAAKK